MASTSADMEQVTRFLLLGRVGSVYSASTPKSSPSVTTTTTAEISLCIESVIANGQGQQLLDEVGRSRFTVSRTATAYVLAVCSVSTDEKIMAAALDVLPSVCPTSKDLLAFVHARESLCKTLKNASGWGRALRRAVRRWYEDKSPMDLALKCANRLLVQDGWTHRDVLRLAHINSRDIGTAVVIRYLTHGFERAEKDFGSEKEATADVLQFLSDFQLFGKPDQDLFTAILIEKHSFSFESVPSGLKKSHEVLQSVIPKLSLEQLLLHLRWFGKLGFLSSRSVLLPVIVERMMNADEFAVSQVHPIVVYTVLMKFEAPEGKIAAVFTKKDGSISTAKPRQSALTKPKSPSQLAVTNALKILMATTFKHFPVTGKRYLIAVDVRNPMSHRKLFGCRQVTAAHAAAIIIRPVIAVESSVTLVAFGAKDLSLIDIKAGMSEADITSRMRETPMGPVDCAKPMLWAKQMKWPYDVFMIFTDYQIDVVDVKPSDALRQYRQEMNLPRARVVIFALSLGKHEPVDDGPGVLYVYGMNHRAPNVVREFIADSCST